MPNRFQDIFKAVNTPYQCMYEKVDDAQTKFGPKKVVSVVYAGASYPWFLDARSFTSKFEGINPGDSIEISQKPPSGSAKYPSYQVVKSSIQSGIIPAANADWAINAAKERAVQSNLITITAFLKSLIEGGKHDVPQCQQLALELTEWAKAQAESIYEAESAESF